MSRLNQIDDDIWSVDGPVLSFFGVPYPTRMVVVRLPLGLWVWSPVALNDELAALIEDLGPVKWLVEPNKLHHIYLQPWLERFPEARAYAPPGLAKKKSDVSFTAELNDEAPEEWAERIEQVVVRGSPAMEEVIFFHRPSSSCIIGDLVQRHDPEAFSTWQRWLMQADGMLGEEGSTPREWRATFFDRGPGRQALHQVLSWQPKRLLIAHGACELSHGTEVLEHSLAWLTKPWPV
jgi:hypothetical protein